MPGSFSRCRIVVVYRVIGFVVWRRSSSMFRSSAARSKSSFPAAALIASSKLAFAASFCVTSAT